LARRPTAAQIDSLYGLDPVLDVSKSSGSNMLEGFVELSCPYCAESYGVAIDLSGGTQSYIEDCQVCCQPISVTLCVNEAGEFSRLEIERIDR
jgi:Cysteine-rich CPXCG